MRILVTGAEGFIGGHLVRELEADHEVWGVDRRDGDLTRPGVFSRIVDRWNPDRVVHLAAQVGRLFGEEDLAHTIESNATMTALVAKACGEREIPMLYSSTSEVYGDRGHHVCYEEPPVVASWTPNPLPHNAYGLTKRQGEEFCRLYAPQGLRIVRLSMPYGPGAPPGRGRRALDTFLWQALHRQTITVHKGAERSWCWVGDTVRGIRLVLEQGEHEVYNIGRDDRPVPMLELAVKACLLADAPGSLIKVVEAPARQTVVKRLSTARLRELGWKPTVELDDGLKLVLDWVSRFDENGNMIERIAA